MLQVSNEYAQGILADSRDMPYRVSINGTTLDQTQVPSMTLNESMSGNSGIALGTANAAELTLTLRDPMLGNYNGMLVEPESGLVLPDGSTEWVPLGKFWVTKTTTSNDYKTVKLSCSDGMYHLSGDYESELEYPATIQSVVSEIISKAGVNFIAPAVWPNLIVRVKPEKMTLRNAIGYAAGCCGCNARFNRSGQLEFVWYQDTGITIERESQYLDGMTKLHDKPLTVSFEVTGAQEEYECIVVCGENGSVTATPSKNILEGDVVSLSVRPDNKYTLAAISAVDASGATVRLVEDAEGAGYTFTQPDSNVTVTASFKLNNEGPYKLSVRTSGNGTVNYGISEIGHEEGYEYFNAGEEVMLFVAPDSGFTVKDFTTNPSGISVSQSGTTSDGRLVYSFIMPESDTSVTVHLKEETTYTIERIVDYQGVSVTPGYIVITNETAGGSIYHEGDVISVRFARTVGHEFDHYESNVEMMQIDNDDFKFVMPAQNVSITAYFKEESNPNKVEQYSFLEHPSFAQPPKDKPYWAVFYKYDKTVGPNAKYYLVWFDSWTVTGTVSLNGKTGYKLQMDGYYYCQGANNGRAYHQWNDSVWSGSGAAGSTLNWDVPLSRWLEGYCLIACNLNLYRNGTMIFQKCDTAIGTIQCDWYIGGYDMREAGALTKYPCPDTYSTPLPGANWLLLNDADVYVPVEDENSFFDYDKVYDGTGVYALFFNSVSVENVGKHFSNVEDDYFKLTFPGATIVPLMSSGSFGSSVKTIDETCYVIVRDPEYSSSSGTAIGGGTENTCGLMGVSTDILSGALGLYCNAPIVCDCVSTVSTFSLKRGVVSDPVTLTYTNPLIYEKMVPAISDAVQGITYTPAKVKHRGNPAFQAGDIVTVPDGDGVYHTVLIMQQTMNFGGGMNSDVTCPGQTAETASFNNSSPVSAQIKNEVSQSYSKMSHELAASNSAAISAMYRAMSSMRNTLQSLINAMGDDLYEAVAKIDGIDTRLSMIEDVLSGMSKRLTTLEEDVTYLEDNLNKIQAAVNALERELSAAQADIQAIDKAVDDLSGTVDILAADLDTLDTRVSDLEARVAVLEDDNTLGRLKRELAATDQQIAYCAEIFMFEVMVNGTAIADVILPHDISQLHTTRNALREQIAELEVIE